MGNSGEQVPGVEDDGSLPPELTQTLAPAVLAAIMKWQRDNDIKILFDQWFASGNTEAVLAVVVLNSSDGARPVVLKVCPPGKATGREPVPMPPLSRKRHGTSLNGIW